MFRVFVFCLFAALSQCNEIEDRFEQWISDFEVKIESLSQREHVFNNWL